MLGAHRSLTSEEWFHNHNYNMHHAIILSLILTSTITIILILTPLTIGINILLISLLLATIYASSISSWIAFLIFLIYVGGILVIFAYFVALNPNQQSNKLVIPTYIISFFLTSLVITKYYKLPINSITENKSLNVLYTINNISILLILAIILLFTIVVVVKLVTNNKGPLRPFI